MDEYKSDGNKDRQCFCIGPENCKDKDCWLVQRYLKHLEDQVKESK